MSLFEWDYDELAARAQRGLDRLSVSFFRSHGARIRQDALDFHGHEHVELEVAHGGHRLQVRQYGPPQGPERAAVDDAARGLVEFVSTFDGRPTTDVVPGELARWLAELPPGEAPAEPKAAQADPANPFLAERGARDAEPGAATLPATNPFLGERPRGAPTNNPFAPPAGDERRQRALEWLSDDDSGA